MAGFGRTGCRGGEEDAFLLGAETEECDKAGNCWTGGLQWYVGQRKRREPVVGQRVESSGLEFQVPEFLGSV